MVIGQKDEQRFSAEARAAAVGDKTSALPPQKASREGRFKSKKQDEKREAVKGRGKEKKDKNQNLQTDKCISSFLFNLTSVCLKGFLCDF